MWKKFFVTLSLLTVIFVISPIQSHAYEWDILNDNDYKVSRIKPTEINILSMDKKHGYYYYWLIGSYNNGQTAYQKNHYHLLASEVKLNFKLNSSKTKLELVGDYSDVLDKKIYGANSTAIAEGTIQDLLNGFLYFNRDVKTSLGDLYGINSWGFLGVYTDTGRDYPFDSSKSFIYNDATKKPLMNEVSKELTENALYYFAELNAKGEYILVSSDKYFTVGMANKAGFAYRGWHKFMTYTDRGQLIYIHRYVNGKWEQKMTTLEEVMALDSGSNEKTSLYYPFYENQFSQVSDYGATHINPLYSDDSNDEEEDSSIWGIFSFVKKILDGIISIMESIADFFIEFVNFIVDGLKLAFIPNSESFGEIIDTNMNKWDSTFEPFSAFKNAMSNFYSDNYGVLTKAPSFWFKGKDVFIPFRGIMNTSVNIPVYGKMTVIEFIRKLNGFLITFWFVIWVFTRFAGMIKGDIRK